MKTAEIRQLQTIVPVPVGTFGWDVQAELEGAEVTYNAFGKCVRLLASGWSKPDKLPILYTGKHWRGTYYERYENWLPDPTSAAWRAKMMDWLAERGEVRISNKGMLVTLFDGRKVQADTVSYDFALPQLVLAVSGCGDWWTTRVRRGKRLVPCCDLNPEKARVTSETVTPEDEQTG